MISAAPHTTVILGIPIPSDSPLFLGVVGIHFIAGLICVTSGIVAMPSRKGRGRHADYGTLYYRGLTVVFVTMTVLSITRWAEDWELFVLGVLSFGAASIGRTSMRRRWNGFVRLHISGMGLSYILLLTAFYVDNGGNLPIWRDLPPIAYWIAPAIVGGPIMIWALLRHPLVATYLPSR